MDGLFWGALFPPLGALSDTAAYGGQTILDGESELWLADETGPVVATRKI